MNNILDNNQHGFRRNRSCFTAAALFSHDVLTDISKPRQKCAAVFVDLRKAFDSVCPLKLLQKLKELKVDDYILKYLCAYFTNRTFSIKLGSFLSRVYNVVRGCPQGGILSPLLFAIYYNDVGSALLGAKYKLFADDLVFYVFSESVSMLIGRINSILLSLNNWCETMLLSINFGKTEFMIFHKVQNKIKKKKRFLKCPVMGIKLNKLPILNILASSLMSISLLKNILNMCLRESQALLGASFK